MNDPRANDACHDCECTDSFCECRADPTCTVQVVENWQAAPCGRAASYRRINTEKLLCSSCYAGAMRLCPQTAHLYEPVETPADPRATDPMKCCPGKWKHDPECVPCRFCFAGTRRYRGDVPICGDCQQNQAIDDYQMRTRR